MRILMIAPTPFFAHRGCHVRILEETRALQALGHHVTIYTYHAGENVPGLEIHRPLLHPFTILISHRGEKIRVIEGETYVLRSAHK